MSDRDVCASAVNVETRNIIPRERVLMAVRHQETDRLPRGELLVEEPFLNRLYPEMAKASYPEKMRRLMAEAGLDLVTVRLDGEEAERGLGELGRWTIKTTYFVMALVNGLFWKPRDPVSFKTFLLGISRGEGKIQELLEDKRKRALEWIQRGIDEGADGFIIGDDMAYDHGPFVSPQDLSRQVFPGLVELVDAIKSQGKVAFLHSCGNLSSILDLILSSGFDGLHGLAPSAGNEPLSVRQMTRKKLTLMGIFEVDRQSPQKIQEMKEEIIVPLAKGGGYILGSAGGLSGTTPLDSFRALYQG